MPLPVRARVLQPAAPRHLAAGGGRLLLRSGEFIPAARSQAVPFARDTASPATAITPPCSWTNAAGSRRSVTSGSRSASCRSAAGRSCAARCASPLSPSRLAGHRPAGDRWRRSSRSWPPASPLQGHEVHVFVPATEAARRATARMDGVHYHPLDVCRDGPPLELAPDVRPRRREAPGGAARLSTCSTCTSG